MIGLGWLPPVESALQGPRSPVGFSREWPNPAPYEDIATLAIDTVRKVYEASSPQDLGYESFHPGGRFAQPNLDLEMIEESLFEPGYETTREELDGFVEAYLSSLTGQEDPERDEDGDIVLRMGSAVFFVRTSEGTPPGVHIVAPLLWAVEEDPELLSALNEMNLYSNAGRVIWIGGQVLAVVDIPAPQLTIQYLDYACQQIGGLADHFDDQLQQRFGGNTQSGEEPPSKPSEGAGYL